MTATARSCPGAIAVLAGLLLALVASTAGAQGAPATSPPVGGASFEPQPIPRSLLAQRGEALAQRLRLARQRILPTPEIDAIAEELPALSEALLTQQQDTTRLLDGDPSLDDLSELERDWSRFGSDLRGSRRLLTERAAELEREVEQLAVTETIWKVTLESMSKSDAPPEILAAVRPVSKEVKEVRLAASRRLGAILTLQNRVSQQELIVSTSLEAIDLERAQIRSKLFEPDAPPLWDLGLGDIPETSGRVVAATSKAITKIGEFLRERPRPLVILPIIFALAWLAARGLKKSIAARRAAEQEIGNSSQVFQRPVSLAFLFACLSFFWLFPLAPNALLDIMGLLLLVPLLRLLPPLVHPGFRPILYGIAAFYVADSVRDVLEAAVLEGRMLFALECLAAAVFCLALLRPARLAKIPDAVQFPRWPGHAVRIGLALFSIAFVANLLGYASLATVLGEGLLKTLYLGIALYAGVRFSGIVVSVTTKTGWARRIRFLKARRAVAVDWIRWGISVLAVGLWVYWSLAAFAIQDAVIDGLRDFLTAPVSLGTASISLADLLAFVLTVTAAIVVSRVVRFVLMEDLFPRIHTGRGVPHAVSTTVYYAILLGGFFLAIAAGGIDLGQFTLLAGALGVGIGFGLQNLVNNFVSGLILLFERPIGVGDTIDMGDLLGQVRRIGIRSSTVRTFTGSEVIVPNADLITQRVINWTLSDKTRRVDLPIGVKYGTDPEQVMQILESIAGAHERVSKRPAPVALFRRHGDSSLDFELRAWIHDFEDWFRVESDLNTAINRALAEAGIEIPFPQRDLHLRSVDGDAGRKLRGDREEGAD